MSKLNLDSHDFPTVRTIDGQYKPSITVVDSSVAGTVTTYEGWAPSSAKTSDPKWKIRKTVAVTVASVVTTTITWPDASDDFINVWDNFATLTYAR